MKFKEFSEYENPEQADYDIKSVNADVSGSNTASQNYNNIDVQMKLLEITGLLEDTEFDNIESLYGITKSEYLNPTLEVIGKASTFIEQQEQGKSR